MTQRTEAFDGAPSKKPIHGCLLYVSEGPDTVKGRYVKLVRGHARVGSAPTCELVLPDSTVSRTHAELSVREDGVLVQDLGSTNGTLYMGHKVDKMVLGYGARLRIGRCTIDILPLESGAETAVSPRDHYGDLWGGSVAMRKLYAMLERLEASEVPVLITGETGTGKDLVARALHGHSPRKDKPFVVVDCGQVQAELINSELFGHKRGSFTGAVQDREGAFTLADHGTVFLDEIGELPLDLQPKLLRVLETGEFSRVGESTSNRVDVRLLTATHRDLADRVRLGLFREDLYYRLAVIQVHTPPLRERRDDIPTLVDVLCEKLGEGGREKLTDAALDFMVHYEWPGNVRELRNAVHRLLVLGTLSVQTGSGATSSAAGPNAAALNAELNYRDAKEAAMREFEGAYLKTIVDKSKGNISQAARLAGIDRKYLRELLKRHGLYTGKE